MYATIAACGGFMIYLLIPVFGMLYPAPIRQAIGRSYLKRGARVLKQFAFVRRVLGGYDVLPISVNDEEKLLEVTLSSSMVGSDKTYEFKDPDGRIKRLWNKPVAIAYEEVPAAVDPELAEIGHWVREHDINAGLNRGDKVAPYVPMSSGVHLAEPIDVYEIVPNAITPENITTGRQLTKKRFEKYSSRVGLAETMGVLVGFGAGIAGVAVLQYINQNILDGPGGGPDIPTGPVPINTIDVTPLLDVVVSLV